MITFKIEAVKLIGALNPVLKASANKLGLIGTFTTLEPFVMDALSTLRGSVVGESGTLTLGMIANAILSENWKVSK